MDEQRTMPEVKKARALVNYGCKNEHITKVYYTEDTAEMPFAPFIDCPVCHVSAWHKLFHEDKIFETPVAIPKDASYIEMIDGKLVEHIAAPKTDD